MISYSFLSVLCSMVGPGGSVNFGNGSGASEEGITITPTVDKNKMEIGADATVQHSLIADKSGQISITLLKESPQNSVLSLMYNIQTAAAKNHGQNTISLAIADTGETVVCRQVAFKKMVDLTYGSEAGTNVWMFDVGIIDMNLADYSV